MPPGRPPPTRHAAAWPISWKAAEAMVSPRTSSSSSGLSNASAVAAATPLWISTNQHTARKPIRAGTSTHGRNRNWNGREMLADLDDVLGPEPAPEPLRRRLGEGGHVTPAVDLLQQPVQQRSELDHLPVGAPSEPDAVLVARAAD